MAKPHKYASLSMQASTSVSSVGVAELALMAVDDTATGWQGSTVRLESSEAGLLVFAVRGAIFEHMLFQLAVTETRSATYLTTTIIRYHQEPVARFMIFVPVGPKMMRGLPAYRKWIRCFSDRLTGADPSASIRVAS